MTFAFMVVHTKKQAFRKLLMTQGVIYAAVSFRAQNIQTG